MEAQTAIDSGVGGAARPGAQLLIVRHGETQWNAQSRIQGHIDTELSDRGHEQALELARRLGGEDIAAVYASDLRRARQTAQPLASQRGLELRLDPRLRERAFGLFEGHTYAEVQANWPTEYAIWQRREPGHAVPGGESYLDARERVLRCLEEIVRRHAGAQVLVVTHGGVLDIVYRAAFGIAWEVPRSHRIPNAALNRVEARVAAPGRGRSRLELGVRQWAEVDASSAPRDETP